MSRTAAPKANPEALGKASAARNLKPARLFAALVLAGLPLLAAADAATPPASGAAAKSQAPWTTARSKPHGSGVVIRFRVDGTPAAGVPVPVVLNFDGITDPAGASVRLATDGGLTLTGSETDFTLPAGQSSALTVNVLPPASGIGYLNVFTTQQGATSAISVPVQVGKPPSSLSIPAGGAAKQTPGGEKIVPMQVK